MACFQALIDGLVWAPRDNMPDYSVDFAGDDMLLFQNRGTVKAIEQKASADNATIAELKPETYDAARSVAPGWDVSVIEQEWLSWIKEPPKNADTAFIGFCKAWSERRGTLI